MINILDDTAWALLIPTILSFFVASAVLVAKMSKGASQDKQPPQAYLLHASVTHGRYIPVASKHAFTYPALYAFVSLRALESSSLDIGSQGGSRSAWSWAFGYGHPKKRLTAINPKGYLSSGMDGEKGSILGRLEDLLKRSSCDEDYARVDDAWLLTMPSCIGWEGINPLTVYFVYSRKGEQQSELSFVVLEIHNTFGESHVHVLKVGVGEDTEESRGRGYDHQWTFPREFHVSPFNDRSGFYSVAVRRPTHPPSSPNSKAFEPPKPTVRVQLFNGRPDGSQSDSEIRSELKLSAILRPTATYPLTGPMVLLKSLVQMPFDLLLTMVRIHYQAWILHYGRPRLNVYLRPELKWARTWRRSLQSVSVGGGVRWLDEGLFERYARWRVERFLERRAKEMDVTVTLVSANPAVETKVFAPKYMRDTEVERARVDGEAWEWAELEDNVQRSEKSERARSIFGGGEKHLKIGYLSSKLFTTLLTTPSSEHALLIGCDTERWFQVSSRHLFINVFARGQPEVYLGTTQSVRALISSRSYLQELRTSPIPMSQAPFSGVQEDSVHRSNNSTIPIPIPPRHFLDRMSSGKSDYSWVGLLDVLRVLDAVNCLVILTQIAMDGLEKRVFSWAKARLVPGQEPWLVWERAARAYWGEAGQSGGRESKGAVGSYRDPDPKSS